MNLELNHAIGETFIAIKDTDETYTISDKLEDILEQYGIDTEAELANRITLGGLELFIGRKVFATVTTTWSREGEANE
jgi:hypothetical protein